MGPVVCAAGLQCTWDDLVGAGVAGSLRACAVGALQILLKRFALGFDLAALSLNGAEAWNRRNNLGR